MAGAAVSTTMRDPRWQALRRRDPAAEGSFFYSVKTTGVYCRPTCGARTPRPENVEFHASCADAERAGFRPCMRCKPQEAPAAERTAVLVAAMCRRLEESETAPTLKALAHEVGLSSFHAHRLFKAATGVTPRAYFAARRSERVRSELKRGRSVTQALYGAGYGSSGRFYAEAGARLGMSPSRFKVGARPSGLPTRWPNAPSAPFWLPLRRVAFAPFPWEEAKLRSCASWSASFRKRTSSTATRVSKRSSVAPSRSSKNRQNRNGCRSTSVAAPFKNACGKPCNVCPRVSASLTVSSPSK